VVKWGEEAEEGGTWGRVVESILRAMISASAQALSALSSCATVRSSWYDETAGRKRGDARRRAKLSGEYRIFG
jgi:hypothetical protein